MDSGNGFGDFNDLALILVILVVILMGRSITSRAGAIPPLVGRPGDDAHFTVEDRDETECTDAKSINEMQPGILWRQQQA